MVETPDRLSRLLHELCASVAADGGAALYMDDGDDTLQLVATSGPAPSRLDPSWERVLRRRPSGQRDGATLMLAVPDLTGGVLLLARRGNEPFSSDDRAVARLYARQLAHRVTADGSQTRSGVWSRQLEAIQRVSAQLTRLASLEDVGLAICVETKQVIDYDNARVYVLAQDAVALQPVAWHSFSAAYEGETAASLRCLVGEGIAGHVAARGEPLFIPDVGRDPRSIPVEGSHERDESMLVVPMRYEGRVTGVIVLCKVGPSGFVPDDLRLLQILSDQAAVAVENARLLAGRDQLVSELAALLGISQTSSEVEGEVALASLLARKLASAARADGCAVSRWDEGTTVLRTLGRHAVERTGGTYDILDSPLTRRVLMENVPHVVQAGSPHADTAEARLISEMHARTVLLLPLNSGSRTIGLVELYMLGQAREFSEYEMNVYRTMANQAGAVLENARLVEQLRLAADVDQVTGVNNHRYLQERLRQEVARSARTRSQLSVLMIDLDDFKIINDKHGHADGDRVLRNIASCLKSAVRANDVVARYGGDEFVVLMPDTDEAQAKHVARRVVADVGGHRHELSDGVRVKVRASAGMAVYPTDGRTVDALLRSADAAMYAVKRAGGGGLRRSGRVAGTVEGRPAAGSTAGR
jgi:diguanylate cyclase (GGDEF)-like protein